MTEPRATSERSERRRLVWLLLLRGDVGAELLSDREPAVREREAEAPQERAA